MPPLELAVVPSNRTNMPTPFAIPALRGLMGDWIYYVGLMSIADVSKRVHFADEVHNHQALSEMIQRSLRSDRANEIAEYLRTQHQRFFGALVVATYGGVPNWYALSDLRLDREDHDLSGLDPESIESVGFLHFTGEERLFALDGQHRLAGMKELMDQTEISRESSIGGNSNGEDEISVIFVGHRDTPEGLRRTRRLFTTLNKTARPVSRGDIIALDEDDAMAICVRRLIEETDLFVGNRIAFVAENNMPVQNRYSLTTIGNLYKVLAILFGDAHTPIRRPKKDLERMRPDDVTIDEYFSLATTYFEALRKSVNEVDEFFSAEDTTPIVEAHRGSHGGSMIFRPIGLEIFTRVVARLTVDSSLERAVDLAARLPRQLDAEPYAGLMWEPTSRTMLNGHKVTLREILLFMLGKTPRFDHAVLVERYQKETGNVDAVLPQKL